MILRDIRASYDSTYFGASLERDSITIWRSDSATPVTTVQPGFSGGLGRYFIDPANSLIFSGTWEDGLTCFNYAENRSVWHRDDLIGIHRVSLSAGFPGSVFVTVSAPERLWDEPGVISGVVELAADDGAVKWIDEEGSWVHPAPKQAILVVQDHRKDLIRILDAGKNEIGSAPMTDGDILGVSFSGEMIALAEGASGVRILNHKGDVLTHNCPLERNPLCSKVAFSEGRVIVFDSRDQTFVTIIDPVTGDAVAEYERESHATIRFIDNGLRFVDSQGQIFRSIDGELETTLKAE